MQKPEACGTASIHPAEAVAGGRGTWEIRYTAGPLGIRQGGSLRLIPPFFHDLWDFGKVLAFCDQPGVSLEAQVDKAHPGSYHHSNYPSVTVVIYGRDLAPGSGIRLVLGATGGYVSGRFLRARAITHSGEAAFRLLVDWKGNGRFSREKHRPDAYQPCAGDLKIIIRPAAPARIRVTVRPPPAPGADLIGVAAVEDAFENPVVDAGFDLALRSEEGGIDAPARVGKPARRPGVRFRARCTGPGVAYLGASSWTRGLYGISNPVCPDFSYSGDAIYFGDLHVMTGSHGNNPGMAGTTEEALRYARDVFGLDFTSVTNSFHPPASLAGWQRDQALFARYQRDGSFVTLPGIELGWRSGHKNVYFREEADLRERPATVQALWDFLGERDCLVIPHHPNTHSESDPETGWGPHDLNTINPRYERLIEITQNRGPAEVNEIGGETTFGGFGSSVRDALARGYRLGFVGGTDTHRARPGSPWSNQSGIDTRDAVTGGLTGVLCPELTRAAVWEALKARRCFATTSIRALMDFSLNGQPMGADIRLTPARRKAYARRILRVKVAGTRPLERVVIVRNGREVHTVRAREMTAEVEWIDKTPLRSLRDRRIRGAYYYIKFYQEDGNMGWASPIWLSF